MTCPQCDSPVTARAQFRPECGTLLRSPWHRLNPEYSRSILLRSDFDRHVRIGDYSFQADVDEYLQSGCIYGFGLDNGRLVAHAAADGLLWAGYDQVLREWLQSIPTSADGQRWDQARQILAAHVIDNDQQKLRQLVEGVVEEAIGDEIDSELVTIVGILSVVALDDEALSRRWIEKVTANTKAALILSESARVLKCVLRDEGEARRCLENAERNANSSNSSLGWRLCAEGWIDVFGDEAAARRCLENAEQNADDSSDWSWCAKYWMEMFGNEAAARRCLENAEQNADGSFHWLIECAKEWMKVFGDEAAARRSLERAESEGGNGMSINTIGAHR